jgi:trk system potassium uptake protein TrkA
MKIIVIGYGRAGSQFVKKIDIQAHEVVVIDKESSVLERADVPKGVRVFIGNAIDEDLLREAGAESADVILALTRDENTNLMIAQIARVVFNVPKVIAIVYDPQREASFHEAGIETLAIAVAGAELLAARVEGRAGVSGTAPGAWLPAGQASARVPLRPLEAQDGSFYVIVVGGGLVGFYLARNLLKNGHEVTIIERNPDTFELASRQIDCPVVLGDGSTVAVLEQAGASRANVLCAVTDHDQDNLIACQVAKYHFGIPKAIARVKNPKNEAVMSRLGVDTTVSSTAIITNVIESELPATRARTLASLGSCGVGLMEYHLTQASPVVGKKARQIKLPPNCSMVSILREGKAVTCFDGVVVESGDTVVALVPTNQEVVVREILLG